MQSGCDLRPIRVLFACNLRAVCVQFACNLRAIRVRFACVLRAICLLFAHNSRAFCMRFVGISRAIRVHFACSLVRTLCSSRVKPGLRGMVPLTVIHQAPAVLLNRQVAAAVQATGKWI